MSGHVEALFSEAVDGRLDDRRRQGFDEHLARCGRCREGFDDFEAAVSLVRGMPRAAMPVAVRLPEGPPLPERRVLAGWRRRFEVLLRPSPQLATVGAAVAALALFAVLAHSGGSGPAATSGAAGGGVAINGVGGGGHTAAAAQPVAGPGGRSGGGPAAAAPLAHCAGAPVTVTAAAAAPPSWVANLATAESPDRRGARLVLGTESGSYTPGQTVLIYARYVTSAEPTTEALLPCVGISAQGGSPGFAGAVPPVAAAGATAEIAGDGLPLLDVTIPATVPAGTVIHLVATVPAGAPPGATAAITATLDVTVT